MFKRGVVAAGGLWRAGMGYFETDDPKSVARTALRAHVKR